MCKLCAHPFCIDIFAESLHGCAKTMRPTPYVSQPCILFPDNAAYVNLVTRCIDVTPVAQIMTPVQNARCIVRAYPYIPDSAAIATCVAARCGCQSARDRLESARTLTQSA